MEIIIKGSPTELAELLAGLRTKQPAGVKKDAPHGIAERKDRTFASIKPTLQAMQATVRNEYVEPYKFEETVCRFAEWIRKRPIKNGKVRKYRNVRLSEFVNGELFSE